MLLQEKWRGRLVSIAELFSTHFVVQCALMALLLYLCLSIL